MNKEKELWLSLASTELWGELRTSRELLPRRTRALLHLAAVYPVAYSAINHAALACKARQRGVVEEERFIRGKLPRFTLVVRVSNFPSLFFLFRRFCEVVLALCEGSFYYDMFRLFMDN